MIFKTIPNINKLSEVISGLDYESYHSSTNNKNGNKLIKFWGRKNCLMIVCVKGTNKFTTEKEWDDFHDELERQLEGVV